MNLSSWYQKRGFRFILERATRLNERYGLTPEKSTRRIEHCVQSLADYDCWPTFVVPGIVVQRNLDFVKRLQVLGVEIAVHGYNHIDLKACSTQEAVSQLTRAVDVFRAAGIEARGFRCPYLSITDEIIHALPPGLFDYSSNKAIQWPVAQYKGQPEGVLFETIRGFYMPAKSEKKLSVPWKQDSVIEIPVSVPDDLQMHDGLGCSLEEVAEAWLDILSATYRRGEIFNLMFHPELASFCESPFMVVLRETVGLKPGVWIARLRDISDWWKEKADFRVETHPMEDGAYLLFRCSPRATILLRGFAPQAPVSNWDGKYQRLEAQALKVDGLALPFIGLSPDAPQWVLSTLVDMGYIVESGQSAGRCSLYLDGVLLRGLQNPVDLVEYIECYSGPLVRFWPWPDGFRSVLSITGDMDALSLFDYAKRLFA